MSSMEPIAEKAVAKMPPWRDVAPGVRAVVVPDDYDEKPAELWLILRNDGAGRYLWHDEEWRIEIRDVERGTAWRLTQTARGHRWQLEPGETYGRRLQDLPKLPPGRYEVSAESDSVAAAPFEIAVSVSQAPRPSASGSAP